MSNLVRYQALQDLKGSFIKDIEGTLHSSKVSLKGAVLLPITFTNFEEHAFHRFILDDGLDSIVCYCREHLFPEEYEPHTLLHVKGIYSISTDETAVFCHSIERSFTIA